MTDQEIADRFGAENVAYYHEVREYGRAFVQLMLDRGYSLDVIRKASSMALRETAHNDPDGLESETFSSVMAHVTEDLIRELRP